MVKASHRSSESWEFDLRLELRNRLSEIRAQRTFINHLPNIFAIQNPLQANQMV